MSENRVLHFPAPVAPSSDAAEAARSGRLSAADQRAVRASCLRATLLLAHELTRIHELLLGALDRVGHLDLLGPDGRPMSDFTEAVRGWLEATEQIAVVADENPRDAWQQIRELAKSGYGYDMDGACRTARS